MAEETLTDEVAPDSLFDALDDPLPSDLSEGVANCADPPSPDVEFLDSAPEPSHSPLPRNIRRRTPSRSGESQSFLSEGRVNALVIEEERGTPAISGESRTFPSRHRSSASEVEGGSEISVHGGKIAPIIGIPASCRADSSIVTGVTGDSFGVDCEDSELSSCLEARKDSNHVVSIEKQEPSTVSSDGNVCTGRINAEGDDMVKETPGLSKESCFSNTFSYHTEVSPFAKEQMEEVRGKDASGLNRIMEESVSESVTDAHSSNEVKFVEKCVEKVNDSSLAGAVDELPSSKFLIWLVGFVFKAIGFQINLCVMLVVFPFRILSFVYMITTNPFETINRIKGRCLKVLEEANYFVSMKIGRVFAGQPSMGKLAKMFGWGFLWSCYVGFVILGFFILSFCLSGFFMGKFLEEPIRITQPLSFDYTVDNPVAVLRTNTFEKSEVHRLIPVSQRLLVTISLALPESEYNRNLGVFQVVVDFLSAKGDVLASSSQPCMLRFKSQQILFAETFLKSIPLLAGYSSQSQTLNVRMTGFKEGIEPSAFLRVTLNRRAEFRPGEGIPEIYTATVLLESELPILKRIMWSWRRTIFMWIAMGFFAIELLFILVCCRHVLYPTPRPAT